MVSTMGKENEKYPKPFQRFIFLETVKIENPPWWTVKLKIRQSPHD
jgi:hypothetical protein